MYGTRKSDRNKEPMRTRPIQGRNTMVWGQVALLVVVLASEWAFAGSIKNTVQYTPQDYRPERCSLNPCASLTDARPNLLESPFVTLERVRVAQNAAPLLEYNGDEEPKKPKKPEDPRKPAAQAPTGGTPRTLDVPRRLTEIRRNLKIGQLWIAQAAERPTAIRVSLETTDQILGAITLDPDSGQPVQYQDRTNFRPANTPQNVQLTSMLQGVRAQSPGIKFGTFVLPSPRGLEVQVYLSEKLVSYVYIDPKSGNAVNDDGTLREIDASPVRLK
jgi:hypothetical protein